MVRARIKYIYKVGVVMLARLKPVNIHWLKERSPLRGSEKNVCATIFVPF